MGKDDHHTVPPQSQIIKMDPQSPPSNGSPPLSPSVGDASPQSNGSPQSEGSPGAGDDHDDGDGGGWGGRVRRRYGGRRYGGRRRRRGCEEEHYNRSRRALNDPIYFIDHEASSSTVAFRVLGTSRTAYTIHFYLSQRAPKKPMWTCACRDFEIRQQPCKHIQFIWFRVLGIDVSTGPPYFDSLDAVQERVTQHRISPQFLVESSSTGPDAVKQRPFVGHNCPICYEAFTEGSEVYFCAEKCGNSIHKECFSAFLSFSGNPQCPYCRNHMLPPDLEHLNPKPTKRRRHRY